MEITSFLAYLIILILSITAYYRLEVLATFGFLAHFSLAIKIEFLGFNTTLVVLIFYFLVFGIIKTIIFDLIKNNISKTVNSLFKPLFFFLLFMLIYSLIVKYVYLLTSPLTINDYIKPWLIGCFTSTIALSLAVRSYDNLLWVFRSILLLGLLNIIFSIYFFMENNRMEFLENRLGTTVGGYSQMGVTATFGLPILVSIWYLQNQKMKLSMRAAYISNILFMTTGVVWSITRSTILATLSGVFYLLITNVKKEKMGRRYNQLVKYSLWILIVIILVILGISYDYFNFNIDNLTERFNLTTILSDGRFSIWNRVIEDPAIISNLLFGAGPFEWGGYRYENVYDVESLSYKITLIKENSENVLLQVALEMGFLGLIFFILVIIDCWKSISHSKNDSFKNILRALMIFALIRMQFYGHFMSWTDLLMILCLCRCVKDMDINLRESSMRKTK